MRRALAVLLIALAAIGVVISVLVWGLRTPGVRPGASRGERLFEASCSECHGADGRGSWRATLFLIRPGDLTDPTQMGQYSDRYLFDLIKHGGSPIGRPGMPAFGSLLSDADIETLVRYMRQISGSSRS